MHNMSRMTFKRLINKYKPLGRVTEKLLMGFRYVYGGVML